MKPTRTVITPQQKLSLRFKEIWEYRELFYFFTWRDIKVKYKQTYLGLLWAVLQPVALMALFTVVFSRHFSPPSKAIDYRIYVLSGLILWTLFYSATSRAAESIIEQANIIKKIYFPRMIILGSALLTAFFDFLIAFALFLLLCVFFHQPILWKAVLFFPAGIVLVAISAFGVGALLSAFNVKYRDFRYALPFLLQFLFFSSQVVFSLTDIKQEGLRYLLSMNPVNGAIEIFRLGLLNEADSKVIGVGIVTAVVLFVAGLIYFRKTEAYFADLA